MSAGASPPAMEHTHILVVEDDREISARITRFLESADYRVTAVTNGRAMDAAMAERKVDLVLLDLMLPEETGLDLCRRIRATSEACVIIVTALAGVGDRVAGLDLGADDYLGKPFEFAELGARIRSVLRRGTLRAGSARPAANALHFGGWRFEPERRAMYSPKGVRVALTGAETDLLLVLHRHAHQVLSRARLIELARGRDGGVEERTIDLLVGRLRAKLSEGGRQLELIRTVRGAGYLFNPDIARGVAWDIGGAGR